MLRAMKNEQPLLERSPWSRVLVVVLADVAVLTVLLLAFAWPATSTSPRDLPLAVAGPPPAVAQVEERLAAAQPGAFDVVAVPDEEAARAAVLDREVYGAVVLQPEGPPTVLVASAASPAVAQLLTQAAAGLAPGGPGGPDAGAAGPGAVGPIVEDVAPAPADDPRGGGIAAGALPLALGGVATAVGLSLGVRGLGRRLVAALAVAALAGPALVLVLHVGLGALSGDLLAEMAVVSLGLGATVLALLGLHALLGRVGLGLGALTVVLLGNPLSAAASAPELLPSGWGALGQLLPPGAVVSALRAVSGFDGAGALEPLVVLGGWAVAGLAMAGLAVALRSRPRGGVAAPVQPSGTVDRPVPAVPPRQTSPVAGG